MKGATTQNLERAKTVLHEMAQTLGANHGFIGVEEPSPLRGTQGRPTILPYSWPSARSEIAKKPDVRFV